MASSSRAGLPHGAFRPRVAVLVFPFAARNATQLGRRLAACVGPASSEVTVVTSGPDAEETFSAPIRLVDLGMQLHYVTARQPLWLSLASWVGKWLLLQWRFARFVFTHARELDVVICFLGSYHVAPLVAARAMGIRAIFVFSGADALHSRSSGARLAKGMAPQVVSWIVRLFQHACLVAAGAVLTEAPDVLADPILRRYRRKLRDGALYVDAERFRFRPRSAVRSIGYVGRLSPDKGVLLFAAVAARAATELAMRPVVVGAGPLEAPVVEYFRDCGVPVTMRGWVPPDEVAEEFAGIDLFFLASEGEGLCNALLEAMACGTLVLARRSGGIPQVIQEGVTGFLVDSGDPAVIAEQVARIVEMDPKRLAIIRRRARAAIEERYSFKRCAERYHRVLAVAPHEASGDWQT